MKTNKLYLLIIAIFFIQTISADEAYDKYAKEVRESIWAWDRPEFKNYTIPDKYKNESAVIIALHEEVYATGSTKIRFTGGGILGFGLNKELNYAHIYRKMIKLNDKKALEDNSELEFKESDKSFGVNISTLYKNVVGVRLIKADGTIKEINVNEAVSITEGKKNKEANKKLAISELQVGDILDVFYHEEGRIDYQNIPEQLFIFASSYPIISYSVHCELNKNLTSEYRLLNGAPDFTSFENEEGDYVLDVKQTNIEKASADNWLSPLRQYPAIRLSVLYNSNKKIYKPKSARKKGLYKNLAPEQILEDAMDSYQGTTYYLSADKSVEKLAKKYLKENPQISKEQLAEYIHLALLEYVYGFSTIKPRTYISTLGKLFSKYKIEYKIGFATDRFRARNTDVIGYWDYLPIIVANNANQVFTPPMGFFRIDSHSRYEGETIEVIIPKKHDSVNFSDKAKRSQIKIPVSSADKNLNKTEITVLFNNNDLLTLDIDRRTTLSGNLRNGNYSDLIIRSHWADAMKQWIGEETYIEELRKNEKKNKNKISAYEAAMEKNLKEQKDGVKSEIKYYHDIEVKDLKDYSFPALGVTPSQPQLIYDVKYTIDGLVKRAGNNYILDAGKLIGTQLTLDESNRNRTVDVYMPFGRCYEHEIKVEIPTGYKAENVSTLNKNVDNECGTFISSAKVDGSTLTIKVKKIYKHNFEPIGNWTKLVEMIDAANSFYGQSIVLKK